MEVLAISMDGVSGAAQMASLTGAEFPVLADPSGEVVRRYGVYNLHNDLLAAPATMIIGGDGRTKWVHIGENIADRPTPFQILAEIERIN